MLWNLSRRSILYTFQQKKKNVKMFLSSLIDEIILQLKFLASKAVLNYVGCQIARIVIINLKNINVINWGKYILENYDTLRLYITREIEKIFFISGFLENGFYNDIKQWLPVAVSEANYREVCRTPYKDIWAMFSGRL